MFSRSGRIATLHIARCPDNLQGTLRSPLRFALAERRCNGLQFRIAIAPEP
ncbi:MAG TPA: hypothetical protein V6D19_09590 [Stenomitos sp.]